MPPPLPLVPHPLATANVRPPSETDERGVRVHAGGLVVGHRVPNDACGRAAAFASAVRNASRGVGTGEGLERLRTPTRAKGRGSWVDPDFGERRRVDWTWYVYKLRCI